MALVLPIRIDNIEDSVEFGFGLVLIDHRQVVTKGSETTLELLVIEAAGLVLGKSNYYFLLI